jgi:hypothetical protein
MQQNIEAKNDALLAKKGIIETSWIKSINSMYTKVEGKAWTYKSDQLKQKESNESSDGTITKIFNETFSLWADNEKKLESIINSINKIDAKYNNPELTARLNLVKNHFKQRQQQLEQSKNLLLGMSPAEIISNFKWQKTENINEDYVQTAKMLQIAIQNTMENKATNLNIQTYRDYAFKQSWKTLNSINPQFFHPDGNGKLRWDTPFQKAYNDVFFWVPALNQQLQKDTIDLINVAEVNNSIKSINEWYWFGSAKSILEPEAKKDFMNKVAQLPPGSVIKIWSSVDSRPVRKETEASIQKDQQQLEQWVDDTIKRALDFQATTFAMENNLNSWNRDLLYNRALSFIKAAKEANPNIKIDLDNIQFSVNKYDASKSDREQRSVSAQ